MDICMRFGCGCLSLYPTFRLSLCDMCHGNNTHGGWRLLLVSEQQLMAKQREGKLTAFSPHSHTNTPCSHSRLLIGIPLCEVSSKVLHLAGHCSYGSGWGTDLPCRCNYQPLDSLWGTLLTMKSNDGCVFESDYCFIRCSVHYLNSQQCTSIMLVSIEVIFFFKCMRLFFYYMSCYSCTEGILEHSLLK